MIKCPICESDMTTVKFTLTVMDGNIVWQCSVHAEHRFWRNMREQEVMHQDPKATNDSGTTDLRNFKYRQVTLFEYEEEQPTDGPGDAE